VKNIAPLLFPQRSDHDRAAPSVAGQADEFRRVILPHLKGAYNLARYLTHDPVLSEDIVQDAFVRALRGFAQFRGGSPRAWLFAIVRNCCRSAQSGTPGGLALVVHESSLKEEDALRLEQQKDPGPSPEDEIIRKGEADLLRQAIEALPEPFREAIVLRELEDLSYAEIAQVTGVPVGTVMSRLSRGRSILADILLPPRESSDGASRSFK
jgi:RNA polymerase sigma-70 factor (ECF subfamily)